MTDQRAQRCRETSVLRAAQRVGDEKPVERIYICDRAEGHTGQHVADHYYDGSQLIWSVTLESKP